MMVNRVNSILFDIKTISKIIIAIFAFDFIDIFNNFSLYIANLYDITLNTELIKRLNIYFSFIIASILIIINSRYEKIETLLLKTCDYYCGEENLKKISIFALLIVIFFYQLLNKYYYISFFKGFITLIAISIYLNHTINKYIQFKICTKVVSIIAILMIAIYVIYPKYLNSESNPEANHIARIMNNLNNNTKAYSLPIKINNEIVFNIDDKENCANSSVGRINLNTACNIKFLINKFEAEHGERYTKEFLAFFYNKSAIKDLYTEENYIFTPAFVYHHYNSIQANDLNTNQYGAGPLFIISLIKKAFKLSNLDSIFLAFNLVNILVILAAMVLKLEQQIKYLIVSSIIVSMWTIYTTSSYLAPMLYFIRFIPTFILSICIFNIDLSIKKNIFIINLLLIVSIFYNREYAYISILPFVISGVIGKNRLITLTGSIQLILIYISNPTSYDKVNLNMLNYISNQTLLGNGDFFTNLIFILSFIYLIYTLFNTYLFKEINFSILFFLYFLSIIKVVWNNSGNHISIIYFLFALNICYISIKFKSRNNDIALNLLNIYIIFIMLICIPLAFNSISPKLKFENYIKDENYSIFFNISNLVLILIVDIIKKYSIKISHSFFFNLQLFNSFNVGNISLRYL